MPPIVVNSPNMNLPVPVVSSEIGPQYATDVNNSLNIIDGHTHAPGSGIPVTPNGLNISSDLTFLGNNATVLRSTRFQPQLAVLSGPSDLGCLYEVGNDLYYNDGLGNNIRFTQSGSIVGSPGTITGLPSGTASASYAAGVFTFQAATLTAANIDVASVVLRNNTASSFGLTLSPPTLGSDYSLVLPTIPASISIMQLDTSGNMSAVLTVDGTSIQIISNQLVVPSGINNQREHSWELNGTYPGLSYPLLNIDSIFFAPYNITITAIWIYNGNAGTSGTTEYDLKVASPGGSFATIFSTTGKITSAAASTIWTDSNSVVSSQTGVTKPVVSTASISAGQAIRFDLIQSMLGPATDARIRIIYKQT